MLSQLSEIDAYKLIYAGDVPELIVSRYQSDDMVFTSKPMNFNTLLPMCDAVVCHAGHGLVLECLLAGKPLVMLPMVYEGGLTACRVEAIGAGMIADPSDNTRDCIIALRRILNDCVFSENARKFSGKYEDFNGQEMLERVIVKCEKVIDG